MKAFACRDLGNDCSWKHSARTEELLLDVTAIHLRDAHQVNGITPEMIGRIKHLFTNPDPVNVAAEEGPVLKEVACRDLGMDCTWHYIAQTEELIADGMAVHAREAHGITEFTPEMAAKVKQLAHAWRG
jgi:predicted small metal-binding protein